MPVKHYCRSLRPIDMSSMVHPIVQTPDHSSFPSGHAMETFAAATVLDRLARGRAYDPDGRLSLPFQIAHRIATNRTVAGVHFPIDSMAGALIGCRIGDAVWRMAHGVDQNDKELKVKPKGAGMSLGGKTCAAHDDFTLKLLDEVCPLDPKTDNSTTKTVIGEMWRLAELEWQDPAP